MTVQDPPHWDEAGRLRRLGHLFFSKWHPSRATIDIARSIGQVVDVSALLSQSGMIPTVQTLRPRRQGESRDNQYSGTFGLGEFPLHTDLAHWARPPRYFLLRCKEGALAVATHLLPSAAVVSTLGLTTLRRALVRPRYRGRNGKHCLLPVVLPTTDGLGLRWDPLFLVPMNEAGHRVAEAMSANTWDHSQLVATTLSSPGDTLILDNWRFLHGRSSVPANGMGRTLERVYLSELYS